ncbi:MFS transporter [Numidum massiliense]|uniref:MFS transporter n=1 Tax=Numidum massiliense TaxID=1522315 RepID=UPI0011C9813E|nr:MFS transporter [Numidum massiliense]
MNTFEGMANTVWTSALLLSFTTVVLNQGSDVWGFINAAYFIGAIVGSIVVTSKSQILEQRIGVMIGLSGLSMGVLTVLFAVNHTVIVALL